MLLMSKGSYLLVRILPQIFNIHLLGLLPQIVFMSYNSLWCCLKTVLKMILELAKCQTIQPQQHTFTILQ